MRKALAFVPFALVTLSNNVAHADLVADDEKFVRLSIRVDGEVPAGQTVVLGHTFRGMDVIKPGTAAFVEWHPSAGLMQLAVVPSSAVGANIEQLRQDLKRKEVDEIFQQAKPCHDGFDAFRTIPRSAATDVIQWNYRVTFSGEKCTASLVSMQFFDKSGKEVEPRDVPRLPRGVLVGPPGSASPLPPSPAESAKSAAPAATPTSTPEPAQPPKGSCGCRIGPGASELEMATIIDKWGPLGSFAIFALALGLRRKSIRK